MNFKIIAGAAAQFFSAIALAQGALENPANNSTDSGIGIISGWHCSATRVEAIIDGKSAGFAYVGSERLDTASICKKTNSGFSLLVNFNNLSRGSHNLKMYADGVLFGESKFKTTQSGGTAFLTNKSKTVDVPDFPSAGSTATLTWSQSKQSFVVTNISTTVAPPPGPGPAPTGLAKLYGRVTFNYSFSYTGAGFTDVFYFSHANYNNSDKTITAKIEGENKNITCLALNMAGYEFFCSAKFSTGSSDNFIFNISSAGVVSGKYEYCPTSVSDYDCGVSLASNSDGTVSGNVVTAARSTASFIGASAPESSKDQLKVLQLQQEAREPSTESVTPEQLDAVLDALERLAQ